MTRSSIIRNIALPLLLAVLVSGSVMAKGGRTYPSQNDTLRLFLIGNSFSGNSSRFLPEIVKDRGRHIIIGSAGLGGCSLERHWSIVEMYEKDNNDPAGKPYTGTVRMKDLSKDPDNGKSLKELLTSDKWQIITIQQASRLSMDENSFRPYAKNLRDYSIKACSTAEVVMHETWAYREDAKSFGSAKSAEEMWSKLHEAYYNISAELGIRVMPVGDAFHMMQSDPKWKFVKDPNFDPKTAVEPALPADKNSLHTGARWNKGKLGYDYNHAGVAGCYLGGLVWYGFLYGESPKKVTFAPEGISPEFAAQLRKVADKILKQNPRK